MITLIKKIAIRERPTADLTDPAVSPYLTTVELVNVMEGVDGAATFGYSLETVAVQVEDNQTQQYKHIHTFDVRVLDAGSDNSTIDGWILEQKPVDIVGIGVDGYFQFDNVKLTRNKQYDEVFASAFLATAETLTSYTQGHVVPYWYENNSNEEKYTDFDSDPQSKLRAYAGANLYDIYDLNVSRSNINGVSSNVWQNGVYFGYTQSASTVSDKYSSNVNGSNVIYTRPKTSTSYLVYQQIFFPFSGEELSASINVVDVNTESGGDPARIGIYERGGNGNINRSSVINITSGTPGRYTTEPITVLDTTKVVMLYVRPGTSPNSNLVFDDIGIYPTAVAPFGGTKSTPTQNTNPGEPTE